MFLHDELNYSREAFNIPRFQAHVKFGKFAHMQRLGAMATTFQHGLRCCYGLARRCVCLSDYGTGAAQEFAPDLITKAREC